MPEPMTTIGASLAPLATRLAKNRISAWTFNYRLSRWFRKQTIKAGLPVPRFWKFHRFLKDYDVLATLVSGSAEKQLELSEAIGNSELSPAWFPQPDEIQKLVILLLSGYTHFEPMNQAIELQTRSAVAELKLHMSQGGSNGAELFEESLKVLPPIVASEARRLVKSWPDLDHVVIEFLRSENRKQLLKDWSVSQPPWLVDAPPSILVWFSSLMEQFGFSSEAVPLIAKALEAGVSPASFWEMRKDLLVLPANADAQRNALQKYENPHYLVAVIVDFLDGNYEEARATLRSYRGQETIWEEQFGTLLDSQLLVAQSKFDEAIALASSELLAGHAEVTKFVAERLFDNGIARTSELHFSHLRSSFDLAIKARDRIREWEGPSSGPLETAIKAAEALGNLKQAWLLTQADGEATHDEAATPNIRDLSLVLAAQTQPLADIEQQVILAPKTLRREQALALIAERRDDAEIAIHHWQQAIELSAKPEHILENAYQLASHGIYVPKIEALRDQYPEQIEEIISLSKINRGVLEDLDQIKSKARRSKVLTHGLISYFQSNGRKIDAGIIAAEGASRWRDPDLWYIAAQNYFAIGNFKEASNSAKKALQSADPSWEQSKSTSLLLTHALNMDGKRSEAAVIAAETMARFPEDPSSIWNLVICQVQLHRNREAWETYSHFGNKPEPRGENEACVRLLLWQEFEAEENSLSEMLDLQNRWPESEQVKVATARALLFNNGRFSDEAQDCIRNTLRTIFSELPHVFVQKKFDAAHVEDFLDDLVADIPDTSEADSLVLDGTYPFGMAASIHRKSYTELLVSREGPLFANNAQNFENEVEAAIAAVETNVVIDASAIVSLTYFDQDMIDQLFGFPLTITASLNQRLDAANAQASLSQLSTLSVTRSSRGTARLRTISDAEASSRLTRANKAVQLFDSLNCVERTWPLAWPEMEEHLEDFLWLESVELAQHDSPSLFWCDDVRLRQFASTLGLKVFSTSALIQALYRQKKLSAELVAFFQATLINRGLVGGEYNRQWAHAAAELNGWSPRGLSDYIAWGPISNSPQDLIEFIFKASFEKREEPSDLKVWIEALAQWFARYGGEEHGPRNHIIFLRRLLLETWLTPNNFSFVLAGMREIAELYDYPDPLEDALRGYYEELTREIDHRYAAEFLKGLVSQAHELDRSTALKVILEA